MENGEQPVPVEEVVAEQQLALAKLEQLQKDIEKDLPALGGKLWKLAHEENISKEEQKDWLDWIAKLSIYYAAFDELTSTMSMMITNNIGLLELHARGLVDLDEQITTQVR